MKKAACVMALIGLAIGPALAAPPPVTPEQARAHEGECISVEGPAHIYVDEQRAGLDVELGGANHFEGYIPYEDEAVYPEIRALEGRMVDISGVVQFYHAEPEIKMAEHHQLLAAPPPGAPHRQMMC